MDETTPGGIPAETFRSLSGLEFLRAVADGKLPRPPFGVLLDFGLDEVEPGRTLFSGTPGPRHYNPIGSVHGGYAATLLDSCMSCAVQTVVPAGSSYTTLELKVNFVRPITCESGRIYAEGRVLSSGRRTGTAEGFVRDGNGKLLAHGTTTCLIFPV
jgi:uncharacterized protein (TIGR00369 family)